MPYFFFSYARSDSQDKSKLILRFYEDLLEEISPRIGNPPANQVGFIDRKGIEAGEEWEHEIADALQTSRVMVPLFSPTYFSREACGKEWTIFRQRQDLYLQSRPPGARRPPVILPVIWIPGLPESLPKALSAQGYPANADELQRTLAESDDDYAKHGLRRLMKLKGDRPKYEKFVVHFADRLIEVARTPDYQIPALRETPRFRDVESAFHVAPGGPIDAEQPDLNSGTKFVQFIYVAGTRGELKASNVRNFLESYGTRSGMEWQPFNPDVARDIGMVAAVVAGEEGFHYEPVALGPDLIAKLERAESNNQIVIIIADPWSLKIDHYCNLMKTYDTRRFKNCAVMIPWNIKDPDCAAKRSELELVLKRAFDRNMSPKDPNSFHDLSTNLDQFKKELATLLNRIRSRLMGLVELPQGASDVPVIPKPVITGPEAGRN